MKRVRLIILMLTLALILAGCRQPTSAEVEQNSYAFAGSDLLTGEKVSFPADSNGRIAVVSFFSLG